MKAIALLRQAAIDARLMGLNDRANELAQAAEAVLELTQAAKGVLSALHGPLNESVEPIQRLRQAVENE